jgi:GDP-4-dehydro-6-deoxy-D-mannose reductase
MGDVVYETVNTEPVSAVAQRLFTLDVTDFAKVGAVLHEVRPDVVYHLAAIAFVPEAEAHFDRTLRVNVLGTSNVVRHCHLLDAQIRIVYVSSAEVYGQISSADLPVSEDTPLRPANNYSLSKQMAELVVERYQRMGSVRATIARPFNHIGPGQSSRFVVASFAQQLARIAHGKAERTLLVGNLEARRDFSDVRDIVRAYRLMATKGSGIYNLGSGSARAVSEVLNALIEVSGVRVDVRQDPARLRGPEVPELYGCITKAHNECGWSPAISFEQSLRDVYQYWYDQVAVE